MEFHRVLGTKIYCMYTKLVSDIIQRHGLSHHSYADDTQLYMAMVHSNNDWRDGRVRIELCVSEIRGWMNQNMLKLNDDKTDLIVFASNYKQDLYNDLSITIGDTWSLSRDNGIPESRSISVNLYSRDKSLVPENHGIYVKLKLQYIITNYIIV